MPQGDSDRSPMPVPPLLKDLAGWTWRVLLLALAAYLAVWFLDVMYFLVLPAFGALLATALSYPIVTFLRRRGLPRALATWLTVLLAVLAVVGVVLFVTTRASAEYPDLVDQVQHFINNVHVWLVEHLHVKSTSFNNVQSTITDWLSHHRNAVASGALSGITTIGEAAAAFVLWLFMTFFFLYDGDHIWNWLVGLFPGSAHDRVRGAGAEAWDRLAGFVRGTFLIAVFHGVVIGVALAIMGVPLVAPLAVLVFLGSFLPIIGAFLFGGLAVIVTLVTNGWIYALILTAVLVLDNQIEAHLLQPFLVGRYVRLHPLAVAVAIAGGGLLEGIYGAILAVPVVAAGYAIVRFLVTGEAQQQRAADTG
jgi:predicted PurR-regulated permease PerM